MTTEPIEGQTYRVSDLPPGSVIRVGGNEYVDGTEYVVSRNGLAMRWEQPIPGSEHFRGIYVGQLPPGEWMTDREWAEVAGTGSQGTVNEDFFEHPDPWMDNEPGTLTIPLPNQWPRMGSGNYKSPFSRYKRKLRWKSSIRKQGSDWYADWIGNPVNHVPQYGMRFSDDGDAVPGGYNWYTFAQHPETGERMGHIAINSADNEGIIADLSVEPQYRRQGVATKLLDYVRRANPEMSFSHGGTTPEGEAWRLGLPPELQGQIPPMEQSGERLGYVHAPGPGDRMWDEFDQTDRSLGWQYPQDQWEQTQSQRPQQQQQQQQQPGELPPEMSEAVDALFAEAFRRAQADSPEAAYQSMLRSLQMWPALRMPFEQAKELADHWLAKYKSLESGQ